MTAATHNVRKDYFFKMVGSPVGGLKLVASNEGLAATIARDLRSLEATPPR